MFVNIMLNHLKSCYELSQVMVINGYYHVKSQGKNMSTHLKPLSSHVQPLFFSSVSMPIRKAIAFPSSAPPQVDDFLGDGTFGRVLLARDTNRERNRGEAASAGGLREKWGQFMDVLWLFIEFMNRHYLNLHYLKPQKIT